MFVDVAMVVLGRVSATGLGSLGVVRGTFAAVMIVLWFVRGRFGVRRCSTGVRNTGFGTRRLAAAVVVFAVGVLVRLFRPWRPCEEKPRKSQYPYTPL